MGDPSGNNGFGVQYPNTEWPDEAVLDPVEQLSLVVPLARQIWIGAPPWLNDNARQWWGRVARCPSRRWDRGDPVVTLVAMVETLTVLLVMVVGVAFVARLAGGAGKATAAAEESITLWLPTMVSGFVLSRRLSLALGRSQQRCGGEVHPVAAVESHALPGLLDGLGLSSQRAGLLASDADRLWTIERLEIAEARHLVSMFGVIALRERALVSRHVDGLYKVLFDALQYPSAERVDAVINEALHAVAEGQVTEEAINPLLERVVVEGTTESLSAVRAAHVGRPTDADRQRAQRVLDDAFATGQLTDHRFADRSQRLRCAHSTWAITGELEGLRSTRDGPVHARLGGSGGTDQTLAIGDPRALAGHPSRTDSEIRPLPLGS